MHDDELREVSTARLGRVLRGKYRLDRILGVGGMATVYAATHRNKMRFAIKMLHPQLSLEETIRTRFLREGYVANSVGHPGAVAVLDDDVAEDGSAFLVMELLEGAALDEVAQRYEARRLPLPLALSIGDALLDVLAVAHAKGIVHRDLKPANLFLTDDGRLEILDFGIARLHDETSDARHATQTGAMLGTPAFMAPEQALGESRKVDAQTDLWAAGATLFTLLSGALVHDGENASKLLVQAGSSRARSLTSVAPDAPRAVANVLDRALAFERKDRWETATTMREALAKACREATGAAAVALPTMVRMTGLEKTVASDGSPHAGPSGTGFEPTVDAGEAKPLPTAQGTSKIGAKGVQLHLPRRRRVFVALASMTTITAIAGGVFVWRAAHSDATLARAPAPRVPEGGAVTPGPGRLPANADATASWEAAVQAHHDGNEHSEQENLRDVIAHDSSFAPAYLRLALVLLARGSEAEAHIVYRKAVEHRASLGEVDAALLEAFEPRFRDPPDRAERTRRLEVAAKRFPGDVFVQNISAVTLWDVRRYDDAAAAAAHAIAIDPSYVPAYEIQWMVAKVDGDASGARAVVDRCLESSPSALECILDRAFLERSDGHCSELKDDARRILSIEPAADSGYALLGEALLALGEPLETVLEAGRRHDANLVDPAERHFYENSTTATMDLLRGDMRGAAKAGSDVSSLAASSGNPTPSLLDEVDIAFEMGDLPAARDFTKKARALTNVVGRGEHDIATEARLALARVHTGDMGRDALRAEQAQLLGYQREDNERRGVRKRATSTWQEIYADGARDDVDGHEALEALAVLDASSSELDDWSLLYSWGLPGSAGVVFALGGRYAEAIPMLERRVASCSELANVIQYNRALYFLGLSREKTGDAAGAIQAYERVLARWGKATPRSMTAEAARAGLSRIARNAPAVH